MESNVTDNPASTPRVCSTSLVPISHGVYYCSTNLPTGHGWLRANLLSRLDKVELRARKILGPSSLSASVEVSHDVSVEVSHECGKRKGKEKRNFLVQKCYRHLLRSVSLCFRIACSTTTLVSVLFRKSQPPRPVFENQGLARGPLPLVEKTSTVQPGSQRPRWLCPLPVCGSSLCGCYARDDHMNCLCSHQESLAL